MSVNIEGSLWKDPTSGVIKRGSTWIARGVLKETILTYYILIDPETNEEIGTAEQKDRYKLFPSLGSEHNIFNPVNIPNDGLFWLLLFFLGKKNPRIVERILVSLFNSAGDALDALCRAGSANRISAWASARLTSLFFERFGLITQTQAHDFSSGINIITGAEVAEEFTALVPWKALSPDMDFPSTVILGSKHRRVEVRQAAKRTKISKSGEIILEES